MYKLAKGASGEQIDALCEVLNSTVDPEVRISVARTLGMIGSPKAIPGLLPMLHADDYGTRKCAAQALGRIGDERAARPLIVALCDEEREVRQAAAMAYQHIKYRDAVVPLFGMLRFDHPELDKGAGVHYSVREAVKALGHQGDRRAVPALARIMNAGLGPKTRPLSRPAALAIGQIVGEDFTEMVYVSMGHQMRLGSPDKARAWLAEHPAAMNDAEGNKLLESLFRIRALAARLGKAAPGAVPHEGERTEPVYLKIVPYGKLAVATLAARARAADAAAKEGFFALGLMRDPDLAGLFRRQTQYRNTIVANWALTYLNRRDVDGSFVRKLQSGRNVVEYAALELGKTKDAAFVKPLCRALRSPGLPKREIILALLEIGDKRAAFSIVGTATFWPDASWVPLAVVAVEKLDGKANLVFFKIKLQSSNAPAIMRALEAIERIGDASCIRAVVRLLESQPTDSSIVAQARKTLHALKKRQSQASSTAPSM